VNTCVIMMDHMGTENFHATVMIAGKKYMTHEFSDAMVLINAIQTSGEKGIDLATEKLYESYPYVGVIVEEIPFVKFLILAYSVPNRAHTYYIGDMLKISDKKLLEEWPPAALIIKE
jgi:hypothetical protein